MARRLPFEPEPLGDQRKGQNEERSQLSTALGGEYSRERLEGLREAAPSAPDDAMHVELEQRNEDHPERLDERREAKQDADEAVAYRKSGLKLRKELAVPEIRAEAMRLAELTPTLEDDASARRLPRGLEHIIENSADTVDDFEDRVLNKYQ